MNKTRKTVIVAATAVALTFGLSSCAGTGQLDMQGRDIKLPDGRTVVCVASIDKVNGGSGGVSCDWENAR